MKNQESMSELAVKLQQKIKTYKQQIENHPEQLLVESLPLLLRQSCARTDTAEGGGLGTGCKEDIASPSSVMLEETPGVGWDRGVEEDTSFSS